VLELAAQDVAVRAVNAKDAASVAALHAWLQPGRTAVLVGSSGAGKSTLTNTLLGMERMKTNEVRESDSRGRHTTTYRALIPLPTGACLIDTPGMRELKPTGEEDVAERLQRRRGAGRAMPLPRLQAPARTRLRGPRRDRGRQARPAALRQLPQAAAMKSPSAASKAANSPRAEGRRQGPGQGANKRRTSNMAGAEAAPTRMRIAIPPRQPLPVMRGKGRTHDRTQPPTSPTIPRSMRAWSGPPRHPPALAW
jgi:energy-coupling factor transporter ATP-binding protein EcfA2